MKFVITGHMRSGQHAIHMWIVSGLPAVCYMTAPWWNGALHPPQRRVGEAAPQALRARFRGVTEHTLIETEEVPLRALIPWPTRVYGARESCTWVVVLRSFPNWLASRVEYERKKPLNGNKCADPLKEWCEFAELALSARGVPVELAVSAQSTLAPVTLLYDRWVIDGDYRAEIQSQLGLRDFQLSDEYVPLNGGGSSFIGINRESDASAYLERYRTLEAEHIQQCLDLKCRTLVERLFGAEQCAEMYAWLEAQTMK